MKQFQHLTLFVIALILLYNSSLSNSSKKLSEEIQTESFELPGFSSKSISEVLSESLKEEEKQFNEENSYKIQVQKPIAEETPQINMIETDVNSVKPYLKEGKMQLQNWFSISSKAFGNMKKFPEVDTESGAFAIDYVNKGFKRINPLFKKGSSIPTQNSFWFRLSNVYLWYTFNKSEINVIGRIEIKNISDLRFYKSGKEYCFKPVEKNADSWGICNKDKALVTKWFCAILKLTKLSKDDKCDPKKYQGNMDGKVIFKTITQPVIIIPTPSHNCNAGWNYAKKGSDWECLCKEGLEQSPIDLPPVSKAIETDARPVFEYEKVEVKMTSDYGPAKINAGDNNVIRYEHEALRIRHPNFGKIVTLDGAVYMAQEIVFHTPSEHTINGVRFDMEMQIIHYGKSVGDTLKTVILSFLFKAKPGSFNKFIDKLDFFDLPNPITKAKELSRPLFIPHILLDSNDEDMSMMLPFSFFTYQGSHTAPPCAEKTIHYVASKPIELSNTTLEMFKESLRVPDMMDSKGNVHVSDTVLENNRMTQPLNGRPIFHYNNEENCPDFRKGKQKGITSKGHYEKVTKEAVEYFFVNGKDPSGIPNAFVVTNAEALEELNKNKPKKDKKNKKKH